MPLPPGFIQTVGGMSPEQLRALQRPPNPGEQQLKVTVATKIVGCREYNCDWYLNGHVGEDEGAPFEHLAGAECGNHAQCKHPNCPCPGRLSWEIGPDGRPTGRRGHKVQDTDRPPLFGRRTPAGRVTVTEDEWVTRLHEGVDSLNHIRTRGL